jgi:hypothetical protein
MPVPFPIFHLRIFTATHLSRFGMQPPEEVEDAEFTRRESLKRGISLSADVGSIAPHWPKANRIQGLFFSIVVQHYDLA